MRKKSLGNLGENLALQLLQNKGYKFIDRNFQSRFGEIDLIFQDQKTLVFVEVKTRSNENYGKLEEAVGKKKIQAIIKTGEYFKLLHPNFPDSLRIDVVAIIFNKTTNKIISLEHLKNITSEYV